MPAPLSGGSCGNGPRFRLVDQKVDSNDALNQIINQYPKYSDFLRPNATKHFEAVESYVARLRQAGSARAAGFRWDHAARTLVQHLLSARSCGAASS